MGPSIKDVVTFFEGRGVCNSPKRKEEKKREKEKVENTDSFLLFASKVLKKSLKHCNNIKWDFLTFEK